MIDVVTATLLPRHPALDDLIGDADHVDVKTVDADVSLREFVAGALAHEPSWIRQLYRARSILARLLRLKDPDVAASVKLAPADIPFDPGSSISFFRVVDAVEDRRFVVEASDNHLTGQLAVIAEPLGSGRNRFFVATIVRYHRWTGPLYFNLIRPFHHLVVRSMVKAGARRR